MSAVLHSPVVAQPISAVGPRTQRRRVPMRWSAIVVLGAIVLLMLAPSLLPIQPTRVDLNSMLQPPSAAHLLGTDENGRDSLARLVAGARTTIGIGLGGAVLSVAIGALLGALAAYNGGMVDAVVMRFVDFALAFPTLFAILLFTAFFSAGPVQLTLLIGVTGWMGVARLVRGNVRELLQVPYVTAARALGASRARVIWRHLLPNTGSILFVAALIQLNRAIITEATISFLGMGVQPPEPTWGNLLIGAQNFLYSAPWLAIEPGLAITLTLLAVYMLGMSRALAPATR
ncbi:MAG: ABC transporter permease [Chloroflexota bacterium]|nr:ABC transporter permease [Chloroflexota bacterium]